jgi:hypothetical protein
MSSVRGYRHLFTVAAEGSRGRPGFQTIACAAPIEPVIDELEELVGGFRSPDPGDRRPSRQAVRMYDAGFYAFSTLSPLDESPDGRAGNYWAETFVVPAGWLEEGGWDLDGAFARLPWRGPEGPGRHAGWPHSLGDGEPLPPPEPGSLDRLEELRQGVPEPLLFDLVLGVVQLTRLRRTLHLVEAPGAGGGTAAAPVDGLVPLLPLLLPPGARQFQAAEGRRTFQLRTWTQPGETPPVDLAGLPAAALPAAEAADGRWLDLSGRRRPEPSRETFGHEYARWLAETLAEGRWEEIEGLYERQGRDPESARELLQSFRPPAPGRSAAPADAEPAVPAGGPAGPGRASALEERGQEWLTRAALDEMLGAQRERLREQVQAAADAMAADREAAVAALAKLVEGQGKRIQAELAAETVRLEKAAAGPLDRLERLKREIGQQVEGLGKQVEAECNRLERLLEAQRSKLISALEAERNAWAGAIEEEVLATAQRAVRQALGKVRVDTVEGAHGVEVRIVHAEAEPEAVKKRQEGRSAWVETRGFGAKAVSWLRGQPGDRPAWRWLVPVGLLLAALAGLSVYAGLPWDPLGRRLEEKPVRSDDPAVEETAAELRTRLLQDGLAARLLARAADEEQAAGGAAALFLDLLMDSARAAPPEPVRLVLAQSALGIGVDGVPGPGTTRALAAGAGEVGCGDVAEDERLSCYLSATFGFEPAPGSPGRPDPFTGATEWGSEQAEKLLDLVRVSRNSVRENPQLVAALDRYDLAATTDRSQRAGDILGIEIDEGEAARLLGLARAVVAGRTPDEVAQEPPTEEELEKVTALLASPQEWRGDLPVPPEGRDPITGEDPVEP